MLKNKVKKVLIVKRFVLFIYVWLEKLEDIH
ncbi:hypothetical protein BFRIG_01855 [Peribacillus frigoritolerans]|jgi:hypothetical protein